MIFFYLLHCSILSGAPIILPTAIHTVYRMLHTQVREHFWCNVESCSLRQSSCTRGHCHIDSTFKKYFLSIQYKLGASLMCSNFCSLCSLPTDYTSNGTSAPPSSQFIEPLLLFPHLLGQCSCLSTSQPHTLPVWTSSRPSSYWHTLML